MLYDISDVCRLFGLTPTSIRKYEEMGLIEPRRSASNKRKYSEKELRLLLRVKLFRQFGLSLNQIGEQFAERTTDSRTAVCQTLDEKERELTREIQRLQQARQYVRNFRAALSQAAEAPALREMDVPDSYLLSLPDFFGRTPAERDGVARWLEQLPAAFVTEKYDVEGDAIRQTNGLCVPRAVAEECDLPLLDRAELLPGGPALHTVYWAPHDGFYGISPQHLLPLTRQAQERLHTDRLTMITHFLFRNLENGQAKKSVEIWIRKA